MITRMQQRRGTMLEWESVSDTVVLAPGEIGLETDTGRYKIGNGIDAWVTLPYFISDEYQSQIYAKRNADQDFFGTQIFSTPIVDGTPIIASGYETQTGDLQQWSIETDDNNTQVITPVASMSNSGRLTASGVSSSEDIQLSNSARIVGLPGTPLALDEAVSKQYVDNIGSGIAVKPPVRVATTANITLSGTQTIDTIALSVNDRVLVKDQTDKKENGIYVVSSSSWTRASDTNSDINTKRGTYTLVSDGYANKNTSWVLYTYGSLNGGINFGVDDVVFELFLTPGQFEAGDGILKTGVTFSAIGTVDKISVSPSGITIAPTYAGQSSITTVGTISSGIWNGATISVARGGTGATSLNGYVYGNGTGAMTASTTIPGSAISGDINTNSANVNGIVSIANGGTGATSASAAKLNLDAADKVHTHNATDISATEQAKLISGKVYSGGATSGIPIRIFLQSSQPSSPADGDLWFW